MNERAGLDETKYTLIEHLTELRSRLLKSILAVAVTGGLCLSFSSELLDYAILPLSRILHDRTRTEILVVHAENPEGKVLADQIEELDSGRYAGTCRRCKTRALV